VPVEKRLFHGYLAAAATLSMWTCFSLVTRMGGKSILTPYDIFALRLGFAALPLIPFVLSIPADVWIDKRLWYLSLFCSLLYCPIVYNGYKFAPAAHGGFLLVGMQPFLVSLIVWAMTGQRPGNRSAMGLSLIAAGIVCAAVPYFGDWSPGSLFGDALIFLAAFSWSLYSVFAARWGCPAWTVTRVSVFISCLVYLPLYFLCLPSRLSDAPLSTILTQGLYQGPITTILAMFTYLKAVSILGAQDTAAFLTLAPIFIGLLAVPLLGETLTPWLLAGLFLVSFGSFIALRYGTSFARRE
jgi:drug/metabolite transporter (DMT)-like permease